MRANLVDQFKNVGLTLKLLDKPISRGNFNTRNVINDIFQMDIGRKVQGTRRTEWFEIYPGHEDNVIQIIDVDSKLNQILLLVQEPEREFETEETKSRYSRSVHARRNRLDQTRVQFRETDTHFIITNKTPAGKRHFLMGVDERQLFVAQLKTGVANIIEARKQLGNTVLFHESVRKMSPGRQGEWFFLKATKAQEEIIELLLDKKSTFILTKENIGKHAGRPRGNPHIADELVIIPNNPEVIKRAQSSKYARKNKDLSRVEPIYPIRQKEVFVRGCIRHVDHKTIKYKRWYQVILNNEGDTGSATQTWID
jgi:hypothetical protein